MFTEYAKAFETNSHAEWLELRRKGIGGSDASVVIGVNKWRTPIELYNEKKGVYPPKDLSKNKKVQVGIDLEDNLFNIFKVLNQDKYETIKDKKTYISIKYPYMIANIDGVLIDKKTNEKVGLEIKTTNYIWNDIPDNYYAQVQHYMVVLGLKKFILFAFTILDNGSKFFREYEINFDKDDAELLIKKEKEFIDSLSSENLNVKIKI